MPSSSPSSPGLALLPGRLFWRPEADAPCATGDVKELEALDLCRHAGGKDAKYSVAHYGPDECGAAFGPLSLAHLLCLCRGLDAALEQGAVALTTPKGDRAARLNAAVMLGGYLIAKFAWSAAKLASTMDRDAKFKFVCSWSRSEDPESERVMTVSDVWSGLDIAVKRGWIQPGCMEDDARLEAVTSNYQLRTYCFDATWVIPGFLMVASDPTTVVFDPNPATCKRLVPTADGDDSETHATVPEPERTSPFSLGSVDTVCKGFGENYEDMLPSAPGSVPQDYASFLVQSDIGIIVRVNLDREEGMPLCSYTDSTFLPFGIDQADIPVVDTNGAVPKPADIARMIERCGAYLDCEGEGRALRPGVLVHCKGGFGRSMVFAICLAIYRYDLPGSALLGWARVARPGAITTRKQELFLKSFKGAADVERYAKLPKGSNPDSAGASCAGCSLQ